MTDDPKGGKRRKDPRRSAAARLAAIQALYEMEVADVRPDPVLREFFKDRWLDRNGEAAEELAEPDPDLFTALVRGVEERATTIEDMIGAALQDGRTPDSLEVLVLCILRAGAWELLARPEAPAKVVISQYLDVAHAFFDGPEPGFVNGVLDRLARTLRPRELG